jgi:transcriptional regulator with PAS, ATPase and Fis domain
MALRVARVNSTLLLLGESGVGKGVIAKLVHKHSECKNGPFIRVDCADIPSSLIESELFGYERGAFTGARKEGKPGFLELAHGGTLFLDEIAELPLNSQSKLLGFLEDHEVVRVGGTNPKKIDARIITATNKNIEEMVVAKMFREDLFYRLNVVPIYIQPLRQRPDDILPLVFHYVEKFCATYRKKKILSPEVIEVISRYDFPGNIRELANLVERLVVVSEKERIELKDVPERVLNYSLPTLQTRSVPGSASLKEVLKQYERALIERTVRKYGSQRKAAKALRVDQATVSRKIKKSTPRKSDVITH